MKFSRQECIILLNDEKGKLGDNLKVVMSRCCYRNSLPMSKNGQKPRLKNLAGGEGTLCQVFSWSLHFATCKSVLSKLPISIPLIKKDQARKPASRLDFRSEFGRLNARSFIRITFIPPLLVVKKDWYRTKAIYAICSVQPFTNANDECFYYNVNNNAYFH